MHASHGGAKGHRSGFAVSAVREDTETPDSSGRWPEMSGATAESVLWTKLTPFRIEATRLGFEFLRRENTSDGGLISRVNVFLHPRGTWLDLSATLERPTSLGTVVATFSSWAIDDGELIEVETVARCPPPAPHQSFSLRAIAAMERLLGAAVDAHPLRSASDLAALFAEHEHRLHERGLAPLIASDDPLEQRRRWVQERSERVWIVAPP